MKSRMRRVLDCGKNFGSLRLILMSLGRLWETDSCGLVELFFCYLSSSKLSLASHH
jgi:hypothetical protein